MRSLILTLLLVAGTMAQKWVVNTIPGSIMGTFFLNESYGFAVGSAPSPAALILRTKDGGDKWDTSFFYKGADFYSLWAAYFVDSEYGFAVGSSGKILKTTDSGKTWTEKPSGTSFTLFAVQFFGRDTGFIIGGYQTNGVVLQTTDGGEVWTSAYTTPKLLFGGTFLDREVGYCFGRKGALYKTVDGGKYWTQKPVDTTRSLISVAFLSESIFFAAGTKEMGNTSEGVIYKTTDGGETFSEVYASPSPSLYRDIVVLPGGIGYAIGDMGYILKTVNGGESFFVDTVLTPGRVRAVEFPTDRVGYAVGEYQMAKLERTPTRILDWPVRPPLRIVTGQIDLLGRIFPDGKRHRRVFGGIALPYRGAH